VQASTDFGGSFRLGRKHWRAPTQAEFPVHFASAFFARDDRADGLRLGGEVPGLTRSLEIKQGLLDLAPQRDLLGEAPSEADRRGDAFEKATICLPSKGGEAGPSLPETLL
jgi:hypothetical protein